MVDARSDLELLDLVGNELGVAGAISPALDIAVGAIHAFVNAAALGLDRNRGAVPLIAREVDPAMQRRSGQRVEVRVLAGGREGDGPVAVANQSRRRLDRRARPESIH